MTYISSGTTMMRYRSVPSSRSSLARKGELASWTLPDRISFPMMRIPAVIRVSEAAIGGTRATVANARGPSKTVDDAPQEVYHCHKSLRRKSFEMADELYFSADGKSLRRGQRASKRRPIERSVQIWRTGDGAEAEPITAVATDISLEGVLVQTGDEFAVDEEVMIDIKRSKDITAPSFLYARGTVVRILTEEDEQVGIGIRMTAKERRPN